MKFVEASVGSGVTSIGATCFCSHSRKTPKPPLDLRVTPCMTLPLLSSLTSSPTFCPLFITASHSGPSGTQRLNLFPTSVPLHLLFPLLGMLFPRAAHGRRRVSCPLRGCLTSLMNSVFPIVTSGPLLVSSPA